jgi:hypothetical protein
MGMKKARLVARHMIIGNYSASNCAANRHSLFIGPDGKLAASHSTVIKRGVIRVVIGE